MLNLDAFEGSLGDDAILQLKREQEQEERVQATIEQGSMLPHEVALYMLTHGSKKQKLGMLLHLHRTMKESEPRHVTRLITEIVDAMASDTEMQEAAPKCFLSMLPMLKQDQLVLVLRSVKTMLEVRIESVRAAWTLLALDIVGFLDPVTVREEMVPLALKKGDHNEPHDQRVFGCNLIGRLCRRLEGSIIVAEVLDRALRLCQDTETSVRVAVCEQICDIARCIGLALTKSRIADELIQLIYDEEWPVCRAAFTALIDLVEFFDPPYRREHVYGIIKSFVTSPPDTVATLLIEEFGRMLTKIKAEMPPEDVVCFANFFRISATKADQDIRRLCAFNLPAVVASLPLSTYPTHIAQIQKNLAVDQHPPVRRAVAAGMHELCPFLADKAANYLKESFVALIQDPTLEVRAALVQNLSTMLAVFNSQLKGEEREQFFNFLVPHLVGYESAVQKDWRKVSVLFSNFLQFPQYFNGQILHDRFLPILKFHLTKGAAAIKEQCAELLILFSRHMGSSRFTTNVFSMLFPTLAVRSLVCIG